MACRNPELAKLRAHKREELLAATELNLAKIKARADAGKLIGGEQIGLRTGKAINQYKVAKHFDLVIGDVTFTFGRKPESIAAEAALDGIHIIRTADRIRAHIFLCMLAYYVEWHLREAWRELMYRRYRAAGEGVARPGSTGHAIGVGTGQGRPSCPQRRHSRA